MLSTKVHKARQLASHALPLTRRILSLGKGLLHKVTGLAGRLLGAVGRWRARPCGCCWRSP